MSKPNQALPDAVILCGGAGLRLRSVTGDGPKSMAMVAGRPFLDVLFRQLELQGFRRVILAVGHAAAAIESYYGQRYHGMDVVYSLEDTPLGTGGAIGLAAQHVLTPDCVVMNGDSYTDLDLQAFVSRFRAISADMLVAVVGVDGRVDSGSVVVGPDGAIEAFAEKQRTAAARHLNAGVYAAPAALLRAIPFEAQVSLEREIIPRWLSEGKEIYAYQHNGFCCDIGTPERYEAAQEILAKVETPVA